MVDKVFGMFEAAIAKFEESDAEDPNVIALKDILDLESARAVSEIGKVDKRSWYELKF